MSALLMVVLTHLCVDYIFQKDSTAEVKRGPMSCKKFKTILIHSLSNAFIGILIYIILELAQILLHYHQSFSLNLYLLTLFIISLFHFFIDFFKQPICSLIKKIFPYQSNTITYTLDQVFHLLSILVTFNIIYHFYKNESFKLNAQSNLITNINSSYTNKVLCILIVIILVTKFSGYFISEFLKDAKVEEKNSNKKKHLGSYIGNLERLAILIFFFSRSISGISIVVAIKAITRFKALETNKDNFAEYYLIGSILSLILGCAFSVIAIHFIQ